MTAKRVGSTVLLSAVLVLASGLVGYHLSALTKQTSEATARMLTRSPHTATPAPPTTQAPSAATNAEQAPLVAPSIPSTTAAPPRPPLLVAPQTPPSPPRPAAPPIPVSRQSGPTAVQPASPASDFGCRAALAYLAAHQAPGFIDVCRPHAASGGYGYTCVNHWPQCPGTRVIAIACPAPIVYQNEASNSLVLSGRSRAPIDPYGQIDRRCPAYA
jgi:hypothetical protein